MKLGCSYMGHGNLYPRLCTPDRRDYYVCQVLRLVLTVPQINMFFFFSPLLLNPLRYSSEVLELS